MGKFIVRVLVNAVALYAAVQLLSDNIIMQNNAWYAYVILGLIFGLVNALIKPVVSVASCPMYVLTLGLWTLVVNTVMFLLAGWIGKAFNFGFTIPVNTIWYAFLAAVIVSVVSFILNRLLVNEKK